MQNARAGLMFFSGLFCLGTAAAQAQQGTCAAVEDCAPRQVCRAGACVPDSLPPVVWLDPPPREVKSPLVEVTGTVFDEDRVSEVTFVLDHARKERDFRAGRVEGQTTDGGVVCLRLPHEDENEDLDADEFRGRHRPPPIFGDGGFTQDGGLKGDGGIIGGDGGVIGDGGIVGGDGGIIGDGGIVGVGDGGVIGVGDGGVIGDGGIFGDGGIKGDGGIVGVGDGGIIGDGGFTGDGGVGIPHCDGFLLFPDGAVRATDGGSVGYVTRWHGVVELTPGEHRLRMRAVDPAGNVGQSAPRRLELDAPPPGH